MFKVLVNTKKFDLTNKVLVKKTINELRVLQDIHQLELDDVWFNCASASDVKTKEVELKERIDTIEHDIDILYGKLYCGS
jgi:hypothetical protein